MKIYTLSRLISLLPHSFIYRIGRGIGVLYFLVAKRQRERGIEQAMRDLVLG
jgi:Kdo2-lipid IVA lauroyltransferase/acyltransferase